MRFLNRVHFDSPMYPLELEMYHQIKNVIGVDPQLYEVRSTLETSTGDVTNLLRPPVHACYRRRYECRCRLAQSPGLVRCG